VTALSVVLIIAGLILMGISFPASLKSFTTGPDGEKQKLDPKFAVLGLVGFALFFLAFVI
jgi:hypothetical protein